MGSHDALLRPGDMPRTNRHAAHPEDGGGDVDEGEVVSRQPIEAGGEAAEVIELVEATLDAVAQLVDQGIVRDLCLARSG
jgi:hypothetical protein